MANSDFPCGFRPYGEVMQAQRFTTSAAVYRGDMVKLGNDGLILPVSAGNDILGCALEYGAAGDSVLVSISPEQLYIGQADETEISSATLIGNIVDVVATAGSSTYKTSRQEVDSSTAGTGGGGGLMIVGLGERPDNAYGGFADVIVKINEHQAFGTDDFAGI